MSEGNEPRFIEQIKEASDEQCPVCGYYCLGKGGVGCIDKPRILEIQERRLAEISSFVDKAKLAALDAEVKP